MTIQNLMDRIAGDDFEWADIDQNMLEDVGPVEVQAGTLSGIDQRDSRTTIYRLPLERLRKKQA